MSGAKIQFSDKERELMTRADWILTKNEILKKVGELLTEWQRGFESVLTSQVPGLHEIIQPYAFKISKGENYLGLPWMVLDYPRLFSPEDILAIRTMFWWGRYVTLTLHVSGQWKKATEEALIRAYPQLAREEFRIAIGDDPWIHDQEQGNTNLISSYSPESFAEEIRNRKFTKISRIYPIDQVENLGLPLVGDYEMLVKGAGF